MKVKYASSNLDEKEAATYYSQLVALLKRKKLYLNPELTLQDLAEKLQSSPKSLSQVINQCAGKSFFDFINTYRCQEVKDLMKVSETKATIQEIMFQSGFNSKSSFNKEFKKLTEILI